MNEVEPRPLAELTTLRTGGAPRRMIDAHTREGLIEALREIWAEGDDWFVLGGGSNLFVGDGEFDGTVVRVLTQGLEVLESPIAGKVRVRAQAGHIWDDFVAFAVDAGYSGICAMSGIPGTVGAAPVQNVGAYGQDVSQTLVEVELIDESTGDVSVVPASELALGFRTSVLKHHYGSAPERRAVIISATFEFADVGHGSFPVRRDQLRQALALEPGATVTLAWVREHVLATRAKKGMVLNDADPDTWSAGSFFQNAIVTEQFARTLPDACPRWSMQPDIEQVRVLPLDSFDGYVPPPVVVPVEVKVSAAWLIEHAGTGRGFKLPRSRAGLSTKHALALTNRGGATAAELAELARFIQQRVQQDYGLVLQPEPVLVGVEI